ncbi:MAG: molybdopterin molybdotransferase MoeA, partial [Pseudomonadota bacterium]
MADPSSELISVEEALARLTRGVEPLSGEMVPLNLADGRVLSEDLVSKRTQPPFPASAMDGYAVRGADVTALPAKLRVIGESVAGRGYHSPLKPGTAVRIFTGAPVPEGADTIIIQENTNRSEEVVEILDGEQVGRYIRQRGLDFAEGDRLLEAGTRLSPFKLSLAASANFPEVPCVKKPVVAFIATGDELREPGSVLQGDQIICSNSYGIAAIANRMGASVRDLGIVGDEMEPLLAAFRRAISDGAHIIVTTGGASVGDRDLVGDALEQLGVTMGFWKIAMRPGKPLMYGQRQTDGRTVRFLGLPGNPVSSL